MEREIGEGVVIGEKVKGVCNCSPQVIKEGVTLNNFHLNCRGYISAKKLHSLRPEKKKFPVHPVPSLL